MKGFPLLIAVFMLIVSCQKPCDCELEANHILLLKVDYQTYAFEGGFQQVLGSPLGQFDTLPITSSYTPPGDFGGVSLRYQPNNELIFDGDIVWNGLGAIKYPLGFDPSNVFDRTGNPIPVPDSVDFQNVFPEIPPFKLPLDSIWMDIADLKIIEDYVNSNKKVGYFLYTPSVGLGNPADWDWFIVLNSQH